MEGSALFWGFNREGGKYTGEVEVMRVCFSQWSNLREVILFPQHASWCSAYCGCSVNTRWVNYIILSRLRNPQRGTPGKQDGLPVWLAHTDSLQFTEVLAAYLCLPFLVSINAIHVLLRDVAELGVIRVALSLSDIHKSSYFLSKDQTSSFPVKLAVSPHVLNRACLQLRQ